MIAGTAGDAVNNWVFQLVYDVAITVWLVILTGLVLAKGD